MTLAKIPAISYASPRNKPRKNLAKGLTKSLAISLETSLAKCQKKIQANSLAKCQAVSNNKSSNTSSNKTSNKLTTYPSKRFLLSVIYSPTNLVYPFNLRVTGIIKLKNLLNIHIRFSITGNRKKMKYISCPLLN